MVLLMAELPDILLVPVSKVKKKSNLISPLTASSYKTGAAFAEMVIKVTTATKNALIIRDFFMPFSSKLIL